MTVLKSSLTEEIYDLKNQIESKDTGKHEYDLVFFFTGGNKLKKENEYKTFIIKSLSQNQNNLSNMRTNFFLQQRKLQSFIKTFLKKYQWIIVVQKVNIQLKFIQKNN